jgi:solute carrier family 25 folate transporter 32
VFYFCSCSLGGPAAITYYNGMTDALVKVYRMEGVKGLYRGFVPGMFGVSHGAIQFMTYEEMKTMYNKYRNEPIDAKLVRQKLRTKSII